MKNLDAAIEKFGEERVEVSCLPYIIDPGTAAGGEEYLAYNKRRWGSDGWTYSLKAQGRKVGAPFQDWKWWAKYLKSTLPGSLGTGERYIFRNCQGSFV